MSLFDSFTGPKWQHKNPEIRRGAVDDLDDVSVLLELVNSDPDQEVRGKALARISDPGQLDKLIQTLPAELAPQARQQRLSQLLPDPAEIGQIEDDALLLRIAGLTDDPELSTTAISSLNSETVRIEVATTHPVAKIRLDAAKGIKKIDDLSQLMAQSRGRDKAVYRHCKNLVDEHHQQERDEQEAKTKIRQLVELSEQLATSVDSPGYEHQYRRLVRQWQLVALSASPEQQKQFQTNQASCAQRLVELADRRDAEEKQQEKIAETRQTQVEIIEEFKQLDADLKIPGDVDAAGQISATLNALDTRWQESNTIFQADIGSSGNFKDLNTKWRDIVEAVENLANKGAGIKKVLVEAKKVDASDYSALQKTIKNADKLAGSLTWPDAVKTDLPDEIETLKAALKKLKNQAVQLESDQQKYREKAQTTIKDLESQLDVNKVKEADRSLSSVRKTLNSLSDKHRQQFEQALRPLVARLHEVHDWQGFAIEPKKVELCASMTRLIGSDLDADTLAAKIQSLQTEWKQLGALPHQREKALWAEFKAAADEAWKPCNIVFSERSAIQKSNLEKRMQLVAQLKQYHEKMSWPSTDVESTDSDETSTGPVPDWAMVQKTLDTARQAFKNIKPVNPRAERSSYKAFKAICDKIYSHIKDEYERNIQFKEKLIAEARTLVDLEDLSQAITTAKKLQADWKQVGMTPVSADRKLWKKFRSACDAVFARLDEQRNANKAEMDAQVKEAETLRKQAQTLVDEVVDAQIPTLHKSLTEMRRQIRGMKLPSAVQQRLAKDFIGLEGKAKDLAKNFRNQQEQACWKELVKTISACAGKPEDEAKATGDWENHGALPKGVDTVALETFWQQGPSQGNDELLLEACIALEIHGEIESPAEDKQARMNYQMKRLVEGMGSQVEDNSEILLESINRFIALHPSVRWAERFGSSLEQIKR